MSGVYMLKCRVSGLRYVGGTKHSFEQRFSWHRTALATGTASKMLQACDTLYGPDNFEFIPLKEFPPEEVHDREREAIEALKPELNIYGVRPRAAPAAALYDVGGRKLTIEQIASEARVHEETIRSRLRRGLTGDALLAGKHSAPRKPYVRRR